MPDCQWTRAPHPREARGDASLEESGQIALVRFHGYPCSGSQGWLAGWSKTSGYPRYLGGGRPSEFWLSRDISGLDGRSRAKEWPITRIKREFIIVEC